MLRVFEPNITSADVDAVTEALKKGWVSSTGPYIESFEADLCRNFSSKHAVSMNSGTSALEAAIHALDLDQNDEVILPSFTIISCVNAIISNGAVPVFVDIEKDSWNLDIDNVVAAITPKTKAIMCVHMYGEPCDIVRLSSICVERNISLIEDASQVHGAMISGKPCGSFGDISVFSFFANKIVCTGEGGVVLTNSDKLAEACKNYRNLYFDDERKFIHAKLGRNFRMTSMQAALGSSQLKRLNKTILSKRELGEVYKSEFDGLPIRKMLKDRDSAKCVYWMNAFEFYFPPNRDVIGLKAKLREASIDTRYFFSSLERQSYISSRCRVSGSLNEAHLAEKHGLYFPSSHLVSYDDVKKIKNTILKYIGSK